ncbi:MAG: hypothetical protein WC799_16285 [Desulfobacteraceae bacterium]
MNDQKKTLTAIDMGDLITPLLDQGRCCRFVSCGNSMFPFIRNRDTVTLIPCKKTALTVGDVVAYRHPMSSNLVIHRVISEKNGCYLMKGDNAREPDAQITMEHVTGILQGITRNGRTVTLGLGCEKAWIALLSRLGLFGPFSSRVSSCVGRLFARIPEQSKPPLNEKRIDRTGSMGIKGKDVSHLTSKIRN